MQEETILILGAGISGLIAARVLRQAGCRVQILEGRNRVGGRIHSVRREDMTFEAGPEFIHGHLHQTIALLEEYGISFTATAGRMYHAAAGKISEEQGFDPDWESLIEKMKSVRADMPLKSFLEIQFPGDRFIGLRQSAVRFAEGFDLADADRVGVLSLAGEWGEEEGEQYRVAGGYGQLADALAAALTVDGVPIRLNCRVNSIEWEPHQVTVKTADQEVFQSEKLIFTLPIGVMNAAVPESAAVNFLPALPEKVNAAKQIGFGSVIKLLTQWKQPFWQKKTTDLQFIFSGEPIPTWWTQHPMESNLLTGWLGGPAAEKLSALPDQELLDIGTNCLARIFQMRKTELDELLIDAICCNWKRDIFSAGAYSFTLSGFQDARRRWQEPIEDTLYFAGEACYSGPHIGTVEAAIVSGINAAKTLLKQSGSHK